MTRVTVDAQTCSKLLNVAEPVDLCDAAGKVLGIFKPLSEREAVERARPPITPDELARRREEPDYSTEEVIDYLESL